MMNRLIPYLIVIQIFFSCAISAAQENYRYDAGIEKYFLSGLKYFENKEYQKAFNVFDSLMIREPIHQRTTGSYLMAAKALQKMKKYKASIVLLNELQKNFPESGYKEDALFSIGVNYLFIQRNLESANALRDCIELGRDTIVSLQAEKLIAEISDKYLNQNDLDLLFLNAKTIHFKDFIKLQSAKKYYHSGDVNNAHEIINNILNRQQRSDYEPTFVALNRQLQSGHNVKIGVLLPLSKHTNGGGLTEFISNEMVDGMNFAVAEYREHNRSAPPIILEIRDTEKNPSIAVKMLKELSNEEDVISVIGSLSSDETSKLAEEAARKGIPLVSPTATGVGITEKGVNIFQVNPDYDVRGKMLARYSIHTIKLKTFGIIASGETVGRTMAESFKREAEKLGAKIVDVQYYTKGSSDLSEQFYNLRKSAISYSGKKGNEENLDVAVSSIDGLFLAISDQEEIGVLASQINYFNIKTQLLGSNEWYVPGQLEANKRYLDGITFITDSFIDENDSGYKEFEKNFAGEMKKHSSRYSIIGYDVCNLMLEQIAKGNTTREEIIGSLQNLKLYQGIQRRISFGSGRVNSEMYILHFANGEIKKIKDISMIESK
jgi:branched-chain amino acid transport system substrate-binding protein